MPFWLKGGLVRIDEAETCHAGLGWGKHPLWSWLGKVRLGYGKTVYGNTGSYGKMIMANWHTANREMAK